MAPGSGIVAIARRVASKAGLRLMRRPPYLRRADPPVPSRRFAAHAAPALLAPVARQAETWSPTGTRLEAVWREIPGGYKWRHYFPFYEEILAPYLGRPVRLLEIGVFRGGSLQMWTRYLPEGSTVVGLDIDPACARFDRPEARCHVRIGDQSDPDFLAAVVREFGPFDIVIDDGSHFASHMIASFNALFLDGLAAPGLYVVEDTHSNYWDLPFRDQPYTFMDYAKDLVDLLHAHYPQARRPELFRTGRETRLAAIEVPRLSAEIGEIRFRDSLVAIARVPPMALPVVDAIPEAEAR